MSHVHERLPGANVPDPSVSQEPRAASAGARTVLIRVRFPIDIVADLDRTAKNIGARLGRKIARAAVVRANVRLCGHKIEEEEVPGLAALFGRDPVRRGRTPSRKGGAA